MTLPNLRMTWDGEATIFFKRNNVLNNLLHDLQPHNTPNLRMNWNVKSNKCFRVMTEFRYAS